MNGKIQVDDGPLTGLMGLWKGKKGMDGAPLPDGEKPKG